MKSDKIKKIPVYQPVQKGYFVKPENYLKIMEVTISDITPPISEDESLFFYCKSGTGTIVINGVEFRLNPGSFCWIQSYHTFHIHAWKPLSFHVMIYDYPLAAFLTYQEPSPNSVEKITYAKPVIDLSEEIQEELLERFNWFLMRNNSSSNPGNSLIKVSGLGEIAFLFINEFLEKGIDEDIESYPICYRLVLNLVKHFHEDLTAKEFGELHGLSSSAVNRELRSITGLGYTDNMKRCRINIAKGILLYEDVPLAFTALQAGFSSEIVFYRVFKEQTGMTPVEYREMITSSDNPVFRRTIMANSLLQILDITHNSFDEAISLQDISKNLYISENIIRNLMVDFFGCTYGELNTYTRLRHGAALLLTTDLPIIDIAIDVGFNSTRTFTRSFNKTFGMSPSEFRKTQRGICKHAKKK